MATIEVIKESSHLNPVQLRIKGWVPFGDPSPTEQAAPDRQATKPAATSKTLASLAYARDMLKVEQSHLEKLKRESPDSHKIEGMQDRVARKEAKVHDLEERLQKEQAAAPIEPVTTEQSPAADQPGEDSGGTYSLYLPSNSSSTNPEGLNAVLIKLETMIEAWPRLQEQVLEEAYRIYQRAYKEEVFLEGDPDTVDPEDFPKPTSPSVVQSLVRFDSIHVSQNSQAISLSGACSWDQEHGIGVRVQDGKVVAVGQADLAIQE